MGAAFVDVYYLVSKTMAGGRAGLGVLGESGEVAERRVRGGSGFPTACQRGPFLHPWKNTARGLALHRRKEGSLFFSSPSLTKKGKKTISAGLAQICPLSAAAVSRSSEPFRFGPGLFPSFVPSAARALGAPFSWATLGCFPPLSIFGAPLRRRPPPLLLLRCCCCRKR